MATKVTERYYEGVGRRKSSTARVRIYSGKNANTINGIPMEQYIDKSFDKTKVVDPLRITSLEGQYYFSAVVSGGGTSGQLGAIVLGLSRAIMDADPTLKPILRKAGYVTRDPREVERKKYDHKKARKKPQFSKR